MGSALALACITKAIAVGLPLFSIDMISRSLSSFTVGAMVPGIAALTSGRIAELAGPANHKRYWGLATAIFATAQALSGHSMSILYKYWRNYDYLFLIRTVTLAFGALLIFTSQLIPKRKQVLASR